MIRTLLQLAYHLYVISLFFINDLLILAVTWLSLCRKWDFCRLLYLQQANDLLQNGALAYTSLATQTLFCISNIQFVENKIKQTNKKGPLIHQTSIHKKISSASMMNTLWSDQKTTLCRKSSRHRDFLLLAFNAKESWLILYHDAWKVSCTYKGGMLATD